MEQRQQKLVSRFGQVLMFLNTNTSRIPPDKLAALTWNLYGFGFPPRPNIDRAFS